MRKATADKKIEATLLYLQRRQKEKDEYEDKTLLSILSYQHIFFFFCDPYTNQVEDRKKIKKYDHGFFLL
jgi:hypothetical protein